MKLQALLAELQKDFELPRPFDQEGADVWSIPIDEGLKIYAAEKAGVLELSSTFMEAPVGKEEELYLNLLNANLLGQGTLGAWLSLSDEGRRLTLTRVIDYDVSFKEFRDILEDFINSIDFWREEALNYQQ